MQTLRKSYSLSDLSEPDTPQCQSMMDLDLVVQQVERRPGARANKPRPQSLRSSSTSTGAKDMEISVEHEEIKTGKRSLMKQSYG